MRASKGKRGDPADTAGSQISPGDVLSATDEPPAQSRVLTPSVPRKGSGAVLAGGDRRGESGAWDVLPE